MLFTSMCAPTGLQATFQSPQGGGSDYAVVSACHKPPTPVPLSCGVSAVLPEPHVPPSLSTFRRRCPGLCVSRTVRVCVCLCVLCRGPAPLSCPDSTGECCGPNHGHLMLQGGTTVLALQWCWWWCQGHGWHGQSSKWCTWCSGCGVRDDDGVRDRGGTAQRQSQQL